MKQLGFFLLVFGVINIIFPDFIAYIIGGVCVFFGISLMLGASKWGPMKVKEDKYVKFGDYKIFR